MVYPFLRATSSNKPFVSIDCDDHRVNFTPTVTTIHFNADTHTDKENYNLDVLIRII